MKHETILRFFLATIASLSYILSFSQVNKFVKEDPVVGIWKGSSLCQVKGSACHDEMVVYHISFSDSAGLYKVDMNKVIENAEQEMSTVYLLYNANLKTLNSTIPSNNSIWSFSIKDSKMQGRLVYNNVFYRLISLRKYE